MIIHDWKLFFFEGFFFGQKHLCPIFLLQNWGKRVGDSDVNQLLLHTLAASLFFPLSIADNLIVFPYPFSYDDYRNCSFPTTFRLTKTFLTPSPLKLSFHAPFFTYEKLFFQPYLLLLVKTCFSPTCTPSRLTKSESFLTPSLLKTLCSILIHSILMQTCILFTPSLLMKTCSSLSPSLLMTSCSSLTPSLLKTSALLHSFSVSVM